MSSNNKETFQWTDEAVELIVNMAIKYAKDPTNANSAEDHILYFKSVYQTINPEKPAPKKPLFTTSDGKDVYEGDTVWGVAIQASGTDMIRPRTMPFEKHVNRQSRRWFSTESAANEYVKWHKPGFSLYEIVNNSEMKGLSDETKGDVLYQFRLPKLIEIAKSKIDKP